jgi:hypothetical protein
MQKTMLALSTLLAAAAAMAGDEGSRGHNFSEPRFRLSGWAEIPSTYRRPGSPLSGQFVAPTTVNGVTPPYQGQPLPGFSGVIPSWPLGTYIGLPDNGYGAQGNSADYIVGFYHFRPSFKTHGDGTTSRGPVSVLRFTPFSDPQGLLDGSYILGGPVYARSNYYPAPAAQIPVDAAIRDGRLLTGADFDVESITRMNDGSYWVGEEFGPYLLHFDAHGRLLSLPVRHPVLRAPQNPQNASPSDANLPGSRGFESMTRNGDGTKLYLTTEASIASELDKRILEIYEFDTEAEQYTGRTWKYAKDSSDFITGAVNNATNIFLTGDMTHVAGDRYIVIERDDFQGPPSSANPPRQKKLYLFDLSEVDGDGVLNKTLLVDLLDIDDPRDIGGPLPEIPAGKFSFPLQSVESVTPIDPFTLLVGLDNNYPGGNGRVPGTPDGTELITLRASRPLFTLRVESCEDAHFGDGSDCE